MPKKSDVVEEQLAELRQDLRDLWLALRKDPKKQARKERMWSILAGALGAAATIGARMAATKIWTRLTGEPPPPAQKAREEAAKVRQEASL
ncbi:MAG: DUF4235 domain-containing protein [Actinobacteria bacterium]|nr:DUF4235 domain-containing protein [Actinomycetota bacterium]